MEGGKVLFGTDHSRGTIARFLSKINAVEASSDFESERNSYIILVLNSMLKASADWDAYCQINIDWIGDGFISRLSDDKGLSKDSLDDIFATCFRFLFELYLSIKNDLSMDLERVRRFAFSNLDKFEGGAMEQIEYAIREMPISIFKAIANSEEIKNIKDFAGVARRASDLKSEWDKDLASREERVASLKENLSKYETAFNFVGLFQGFDDLAIAKQNEQRRLIFWIRLLGFAVIIPIVSEIVLLYLNMRDLEAIKQVMLLSLVPTLSLVLISIYYFRVLLHNHKSVKSQLLQIDLRKTLCRFIQNYSDYSMEMKQKDKDSLTKFEDVVFSPIVSNGDNFPSAYDGIEQLAKLIKSVK